MKINTMWLSWLILALLAITWGSSFILIKYGLIYFTPEQVGTLRVVMAFLFLLPFALARTRRFKRADAGWLFLSGFIGYLVPSVLFAYAEQVIDSAVAGILNSMTPIFTLVVAMTFFKRKFGLINIIGVIIGLIGALALMHSVNGGVMDVKIGYSLLIVLATILYAFNVNIVKTKLSHLHSVDITSFSFLLIGPLALGYLFAFTPLELRMSLPGVEWGFLYVGILGVVGSALALMLFNYLIKTTNVILSSSVTYLIPIVATMAGIADGEPFKSHYFIWVAVILTGVFLVNRKAGDRNPIRED
ncbi:MAG: DMT family transporter [Bacteroidales bacterium]